MLGSRKISNALLEGKLLRKTGPFLKKHLSPSNFFLKLDRKIGNAYRKWKSHFIKVKPNTIFFFTFQNTYTCNPKYISEELEKRKAKVKIYWALKNPKSLGEFGDDSKVIPVKVNSSAYFRAAMSSKILVTNAIMGDRNYMIPVKRNQILIQTWHGSLGIKRFDPKNYNSSKEWPKAMKKTSKRTTYCLSNSTFENDVYRDTYWKKTEILQYGHARNDVFFGEWLQYKDEWKEQIIKKYKIKDKDVHFVLYAPTFRDDHQFKAYDINAKLLLKTLEEKYGGTWYMLLRYHPTVLKLQKSQNLLKSPYIINVTNYTDIQKLLVVADVGISDYSSWMFDFMLSRKPLFIYASDLNYYKGERSFYYPIETTPFPVARKNDKLIQNILSFDEEEYKKKVDKFLIDKGCMDDGLASKRAVDLILDILNKDSKGKKK